MSGTANTKLGDPPTHRDLIVQINDKPLFHYRASGLGNIYLADGAVTWSGDAGASAYTIHDIEGLHQCIALALVCETRELTGKEFRFLRKELGLTQADFAAIANVDVQTVARWEKGDTKGFGPGDRLVRFMYLGKTCGVEEVTTKLKEVAMLDAENQRCWVFHEKHRRWLKKKWCLELPKTTMPPQITRPLRQVLCR